MATQTGGIDLKAMKKAHDQALAAAEAIEQFFWHNTQDSGAGEGAGAHITEVPQEDFIDDPANGGGNLLARSNGIAVRDGLTELAVFGADGISLRARQSFGTDSPAITSLMHIVPAGILASINGQSYFDINNPGSGTQTIVYTGDGTTKRFRVYPVRNSVFYKRTVTIDDVDVPSTDYSISATQNIYDDYQIEKYYIVFNTAPVEGAEIRISYVPDDSACNFTLGERESETVSGEYSVSIGRWNRATEKGSLAFGLRNNALGTLSSAIGDDNEVKGTNSHVIGHGLRASRAGVFVVGKYNVDETSYIDIDPSLDNTSQNLFVVGKGSSDSNRSNALTVDRDGNVEAAGSITASGHNSAIGYKPARQTGTYSLASGTTWVTVPAANLSRITLGAGTWIIYAHAEFESNNTGRRALRIYSVTESASLTRSFVNQGATPGAATNMQTSAIVVTTANTTYTVQLAQNSGSAKSVDLVLEAVRIA